MLTTKSVQNQLLIGCPKFYHQLLKKTKLVLCLVGPFFENLALFRDVLDHVNTTNETSILVSLDQEKAFDRVDHAFLCRTLEHFGFGPSFFTVDFYIIPWSVQENYSQWLSDRKCFWRDEWDRATHCLPFSMLSVLKCLCRTFVIILVFKVFSFLVPIVIWRSDSMLTNQPALFKTPFCCKIYFICHANTREVLVRNLVWVRLKPCG